MLPTKFQVNLPRGVGGIGFKATVDAARQTSQEGRMTLTDHKSAQGELIIKTNQTLLVQEMDLSKQLK